MPTDHYAVLGLSRDASQEQIRQAYRKLAAMYHPDNLDTGNIEAYLQVGKAQKLLCDANARQLYDETGIVAGEDAMAENALKMLMEFAGQIVLSSEQSSIDIPFSLKKAVENAIVEANFQITKIDKILKEIEERWEGGESVKRLLVVNLENRRESFRKDRKIQDRALEMIRECRYKRREYQTSDRRSLAGLTFEELSQLLGK